MNVIRGLDRIALVIAVIAILPGFGVGVSFIQENRTTLTPEYEERQKKLEKLKDEGRKTDEVLLREYKLGRSQGHVKKNEEYERILAITKYEYPPAWQYFAGGLLSSLLSFVVVLYGLRGTSRGTSRLLLWIVNGFRDNKE